MVRRSGTSARSLALARATEAVARRDAERISREKAVQAALIEFFHAQGEIERVRHEADKATAPFDAAMRDAVRAMDRLGETRAGITALTGISQMRVREYLAGEASTGTDAAMTGGLDVFT